jgi:hypothetical protein
MGPLLSQALTDLEVASKKITNHNATLETQARRKQAQHLTNESYRELKSFIQDCDPSGQHYGLVKAQHEGYIEWVAPENVEAWKLECAAKAQRKVDVIEKERKEREKREAAERGAKERYKQLLEMAYADGVLDPAEQLELEKARDSNGITMEQHDMMLATLDSIDASPTTDRTNIEVTEQDTNRPPGAGVAGGAGLENSELELDEIQHMGEEYERRVCEIDMRRAAVERSRREAQQQRQQKKAQAKTHASAPQPPPVASMLNDALQLKTTGAMFGHNWSEFVCKYDSATRLCTCTNNKGGQQCGEVFSVVEVPNGTSGKKTTYRFNILYQYDRYYTGDMQNSGKMELAAGKEDTKRKWMAAIRASLPISTDVADKRKALEAAYVQGPDLYGGHNAQDSTFNNVGDAVGAGAGASTGAGTDVAGSVGAGSAFEVNSIRGELELGVRALLQKTRWVRVNCSYDKQSCIFSYDALDNSGMTGTLLVNRATIFSNSLHRDKMKNRFDLFDRKGSALELAAPADADYERWTDATLFPNKDYSGIFAPPFDPSSWQKNAAQ